MTDINGNNSSEELGGRDTNDRIWGNGGDDTLLGFGGADKLWGGTGDDIIWGGAGTDYIWGEDGNDMAVLTKENSEDYYYGGAGSDTVHFIDEDFSSYDLSIDGAVAILKSKNDSGNINYFINFEEISSAIQYDNDIKSIVSLYDDIFDRPADIGGVQYYNSEVRDNGETLGGVALHFLYSQEYRNKTKEETGTEVKFGTLNTEGQISEMYDALFDKTISQSTLDHWVDEANSGTSMQEIADNFIASNDFQNSQLAVTQWDFIVPDSWEYIA